MAALITVFIKGVAHHVPAILLVCLATVAHAQKHPKPLLPPALLVEQNSNTCTGWLYFHNETNSVQQLSLHAGDFISTTTQQPLAAQTVFSRASESAGQPWFRGRLQPDSTLQLKISVINLWEAGESQAVLYNSGMEIGKLKALKYRVPFALTLEGAGSDQSAVALLRGRAATVLLKNSDAMTYPLLWSFEIDGVKTAGTLVIPPNSTAPLAIPASREWFAFGSWIRGLIKADQRDANFTLRLSGADSARQVSLPAKTLRVRAGLNAYPPGFREVSSNAIIFVVLAIGGVCSLLMGHWVPNRLRRAEVREQLEQLHRKIRDLSDRIDSALRVSLRVERLRLEKALHNKMSFSPQYASILDHCAKRAETLTKRVDFLQQVDIISEHLAKENTADNAQTLMALTEQELSKASDLLRRSEPLEKELQEVQTAVAAANSYLENFEPNREFLVNQIKLRLDELKMDADGELGQGETWKNVTQKLPRLLKVLSFAGKELSKQPVRQLCLIDSEASRLALLRDYVRLVEGAIDENLHGKFKNVEHRLLEQLSLQSWAGLRGAQRLLREMAEGIFTEDLEAAIKNGAISVKMEPNSVRRDQHIRMSAHFHNEAYNHAAAREEFVCSWDFGHEDLKERGWVVSHFFPKVQPYERVEACFIDKKGERVKDANGQDMVMKPDKPINVLEASDQGMGERTRTEVIRLVIPLFAALVALIAGAKEQLLKLDLLPGLIAVFLIGFGADTIKNLITKKE